MMGVIRLTEGEKRVRGPAVSSFGMGFGKVGTPPHLARNRRVHGVVRFIF